MPATLRRSSFTLISIGALSVVASVVLAVQGAAAQADTGTVTGRVLWGACIRALPLPISPDGQPVPTPPGAADAQSSPAQRPLPASGLPAGAVLVAVQNTSISARTDEAGRFTLPGVPAGQYLTVAAGPVANSTTAVAERPNVFVSGGQSVDLGTLSLGGQSVGLICRNLPGATGGDAGPGAAPAPSDTPNP
jgi:hypothetical protein